MAHGAAPVRRRSSNGMEHVPRRSPLARDEFHDLLRRWHADADPADRVRDDAGEDEEAHDGDDWVWVKFLGNRYYLHADTTCEAVGRYLEHLAAAGESIRWQAAPGGVVAVGGEPVEGFVLVRAP